MAKVACRFDVRPCSPCGLHTGGNWELFQKESEDLTVDATFGVLRVQCIGAGTNNFGKEGESSESKSSAGLGFLDKGDEDPFEELLNELVSLEVSASASR